MIAASLAASACVGAESCAQLTRAEALEMAKAQKAGMLRRSTKDYAANFAGDAPLFVKVGAATNGYAANVAFKGRDGAILIALIEEDCYVGWTQR